MKVPISECYALNVTKKQVGNMFHIRITETFSGAKNPNEERRVWDLTTTKENIEIIRKAIK